MVIYIIFCSVFFFCKCNTCLTDHKTSKQATDAAGNANELAPIAENDQAVESENSST